MIYVYNGYSPVSKIIITDGWLYTLIINNAGADPKAKIMERMSSMRIYN